MAFGGLQAGITKAITSVSLANAFTSSLQPSGPTTTSVNILIVANGVPQGLITSMRLNEGFGYVRQGAVSAAVDVAFLPGRYQGSASIEHAMLFGQTLESAFGGNLRSVVGTQLTQADPKALYFNIVAVDVNGNPLGTYHDCVMTSVSRAIELDRVVIIESAECYIRWAA